MTSVVCWFEPHDDAIWIIADTRVQNLYKENITNNATKIMKLDLICCEPGPEKFFNKITFCSSLSFAFAGSTLGASMVHAFLSSALPTLCAAPGTRPPSMRQISKFTARISKIYSSEGSGKFECVLAGHCPIENKYKVFSIRPYPGVHDFKVVDEDIFSEDAFVLLGDRKKEVEGKIKEKLKELSSQSLKRAPMHVLRGIIFSDDGGSIGGAIQAGVVNRSGYSAKAWVRPVVQGFSQSKRCLVGINIDGEFGSVGSHFIGITATI